MPAAAHRTYAIVTPAKNEATNVPRIVAAIASQTRLPACWIFVDDHSTDGTADCFRTEVARHPALSQACQAVVVFHQTTETGYALGTKYSSVVRFGFDRLQEFEERAATRFDHFALLDCDVFPESDYYEGLLDRLETDPRLGIVSGGTQVEVEGEHRKEIRVPRTHSAGMMRVWRRACFEASGYFPSISQDAVSEARAIMMGWRSRSFPEIRAQIRKMGANVRYEYYGKSSYVRWVPWFNALLHAAKLRAIGKKEDAASFLKGYRDAKRDGVPRLDDALVKRYFRWRLVYKLLGR